MVTDLQPLKVKTVTYYQLEWTELERFIKSVYGQTYDFVSDMEANNDSEHTFSVKQRAFSEWDAKDLEQFKTTGKIGYRAHLLLDDLCNQGLIPEGEYLITVCW